MSESPNPYEATFLDDEKPVEEIRFLRSRLKPNNVTGKMIQETTWRAFWPRRCWRFIGLGLLQIALIYLPMIPMVIVEFFHEYLEDRFPSQHGSFFLYLEAGLFFLGGLALCCWTALTCVIIGNMTLRLLREEKIFQRPTRKSIFRLFVTTCHCICYALICWLMLLPAYVLVIASGFVLDGIGGNAFIFWSIIFGLGLVAFCLLALFVWGRYAIGLCYIVDRNVGCLTALRRTPRFTQGNSMTIALSFLVHYILLGLFGAITLYIGFLIMPGYLYCWLAVTYLLTTSQYEKPTEPEITEW